MSVAESPPNNDPRLEEILTSAEAAAYLRVSEETLLKMAAEGSVPARKIGGDWRFLRKALNDWMRYEGRPFWKGWPFPPEFLLDSPFAEELLYLLEQRLLSKLKAETFPKPGSKQAVLKYFGVWRDDPSAQSMLEDIYKRRRDEGEE